MLLKQLFQMSLLLVIQIVHEIIVCCYILVVLITSQITSTMSNVGNINKKLHIFNFFKFLRLELSISYVTPNYCFVVNLQPTHFA